MTSTESRRHKQLGALRAPCLRVPRRNVFVLLAAEQAYCTGGSKFSSLCSYCATKVQYHRNAARNCLLVPHHCSAVHASVFGAPASLIQPNAPASAHFIPDSHATVTTPATLSTWSWPSRWCRRVRFRFLAPSLQRLPHGADKVVGAGTQLLRLTLRLVKQRRPQLQLVHLRPDEHRMVRSRGVPVIASSPVMAQRVWTGRLRRSTLPCGEIRGHLEEKSFVIQREGAGGAG